MKNSIYIMLFLALLIPNSNSQENAEIEEQSIIRFQDTLAGGFFQYGIMLIEQNPDRENFKKIIATDMAAVAFNYYFLQIEEKFIDKNDVIEFQIRHSLKLTEVRDAFNDPLGWNSEPPNLRRGNVNVFMYEWHRQRDHQTYKRHVEKFIEYFSED